MTMMELMALLGGVAGVLAGGLVGHRFGVVGAVFGAVIGLIAGLMGGTVLVGGGSIIGIWQERGARRRALAPHFGRYWEQGRATAWAELKERVRGGQPVRGVVRLTLSYGAFVNLGLGFPALLETVDGAKGIHPLPAVGESVEGFVSDFEDEGFELTVSRYPCPWIVFDGVPVARVLGDWPRPEHLRASGLLVRSRAQARLVERLDRGERVACEVVEGEKWRPATVVRPKRALLVVELGEPNAAS